MRLPERFVMPRNASLAQLESGFPRFTMLRHASLCCLVHAVYFGALFRAAAFFFYNFGFSRFRHLNNNSTLPGFQLPEYQHSDVMYGTDL